MRKINKIMMATVSILLTLVLISSCVLSGIFAKYVTTKTASSQMQFERFGVSLSMALGTGVNGTVTSNAAGNSVTATVTNLKLGPGDAFYDALKVSITGTANVPVDIKMTCKLVYPDGENGDAYVYNNNCYMPLGFSCRVYDDTPYTVAACYSWQKKDSSDVSEIIIRNVAKEVFKKSYTSLDTKTDTTTGACYYEESYAKGTNFSSDKIINNEFAIGMYWPYEYGEGIDLLPIESSRTPPKSSVDVYDKMATQFTSKNADISLVYTISITQAGT